MVGVGMLENGKPTPTLFSGRPVLDPMSIRFQHLNLNPMIYR
jgi:hypothetical protein